jgi:hypothetical protein
MSFRTARALLLLAAFVAVNLVIADAHAQIRRSSPLPYRPTWARGTSIPSRISSLRLRPGPLPYAHHQYWGCFGYCNGPLPNYPHWGCYGTVPVRCRTHTRSRSCRR